MHALTSSSSSLARAATPLAPKRRALWRKERHEDEKTGGAGPGHFYVFSNPGPRAEERAKYRTDCDTERDDSPAAKQLHRVPPTDPPARHLSRRPLDADCARQPLVARRL